MNTSKFVLVLLVSAIVSAECRGQTIDEVRAAVFKTSDKISNYVTVKMTVESRTSSTEFASKIEVRGNEYWEEFDQQSLTDREESNARLAKMRSILGCDLPFYKSFDGKNAYIFNPLELQYRVKPSKTIPSEGCSHRIIPKRWLAMEGGGVFTLKLFISDVPGEETKLEKLSSGNFKITRRIVTEEAAKKNTAMKEGEFVFDPSKEFLLVEHSRISTRGTRYRSKLDWEQAEGRWYPKHAEFWLNNDLECEWTITEITFDPKQIRSSFSNMEQLLPDATKIQRRDEADKVVSESYKGGEAGKEEHELRVLAWQRARSADKQK